MGPPHMRVTTAEHNPLSGTVAKCQSEYSAQVEAQGVAASLTWRGGASLLAPAWSGLVTSVDVRADVKTTSHFRVTGHLGLMV